MKAVTTASDQTGPGRRIPLATAPLVCLRPGDHSPGRSNAFDATGDARTHRAARGLIVAVWALADWMWVLPRTGAWPWGLPRPSVPRFYGPARGWPRLDRQQVAAAVEHQYPELGQQVGTAVEYAEPSRKPRPASPALVKALLRQAEIGPPGLDFRRAVPWPVLRQEPHSPGAGTSPVGSGTALPA